MRSPGQEVHLDAIAAGDGYWLITSPEYHMKRLVAAGCTRIVQIGKCWRAEELGPHHRTEFTMIEWYRAGEPLDTLASDCEQLLRVAVTAAGRAPAALGVDAPFVRATVRELAARHAGIELAGDEDAAVLRAKLAVAGVQAGSATAWDDLFYQLFLDRIEPALAKSRPTFVFDWPAPLAALARPKPGDPRVVERFELYAGGLELANAFGELTDAVEQRAPVRGRGAAAGRTRQGRLPDRRGLAGGATCDARHGGNRPGFRPPGHVRARGGGHRRGHRLSPPLM